MKSCPNLLSTVQLINFQMDRTYVRTPDMVAILDHGKRRGFCIEKQGLTDVGKFHFSSISV